MYRATQLSLLKLLDRAPEELRELAEKAGELASAYLQVLEEKGSGLSKGVYETVTDCASLASNRLYGEAVKLALREAPLLSRLAIKNPGEFAKEAWKAYIEITSLDMPMRLLLGTWQRLKWTQTTPDS